MKTQEERLASQLAKLKAVNNFRSLPKSVAGIDFWSNDYLGIARDFPAVSAQEGGATGSRLISGNRDEFIATETMIADYHSAEAALVFNSGYAANLGLLSTLPQRGDTILYDQLIHASLRDGIRLSHADAFSFRHNDLEHLVTRLQKAKGHCYVITEAIFSMDGDTAPLLDLVECCEKHGAALIVDEAHSVGLFGKNGSGLVNALQLESRVFARVVTFGKALGCHGAAVLGSRQLVDYLINTARPFIFSTGLSPHAWASIEAAYGLLKKEGGDRRNKLAANIKRFRSQLTKYQNKPGPKTHTQSNASSASPKAGSLSFGEGRGEDKFMLAAPYQPGYVEVSKKEHTKTWYSPIQLLPCPGNENVLALETRLYSQGLLTKAIRHPTVAVGTERIRICLHAFNTPDEIDLLVKTLKDAH